MLTGYVQNLERYKEDKYGPHARVTRSRELSHLEEFSGRYQAATKPGIHVSQKSEDLL